MQSHRALPALCVLLALALGCGPQDASDDPDLELGTSRFALGEPDGDYPNYQERVFHYLSNRGRLEPTDPYVCGQGFDVPVTAPLEFNLQLAHVARYHAREMSMAPCFQHAGCSFLIGTGLDACSSAKPPEAGGTCTKSSESFCAGYDPVTRTCTATCPEDERLDTFHRFGVFGYQGQTLGENLAAGQKTAREAYCGFFLEGPENNDGKEHGHFVSLMNGAFNEVGHGYFAGPANGNCTSYTRYYAQDFGGRATAPRSIVPSAVMWQMSPTSIPIFGAIWNDGAAPASLSVVVNGTCTALSLAAGTAKAGAYEASIALPPGCHSYYFVGKTPSGRTVEYPNNGSLVAAVATTCPNDYVDTREVGACATCVPGITCSRGECRRGLLECPAGGPICGSLVNLPDSTPCAGGKTCQGGLCGGCEAGAECASPDGCQKGTIDCDTGEPKCVGLTPVQDGKTCDTGKQCWSGVCAPCTPGAACRTPEGCQQGSLTCGETPTCGGTLTNLANGIQCGPQAFCSEGSCGFCPAGGFCPDPGGDPCKRGITDCSSGKAICTNPQPTPNGGSCGNGKVCYQGQCEACVQDQDCSPGDVCKKGKTDCSSGQPRCVGISNVLNGTRCGAGAICVAGECETCVDGAACSDTDECRVGQWKCTTGGAMCQNQIALEDGTPCQGGRCLGGGCAPIIGADAGGEPGGSDAGTGNYEVADGCGCSGAAGPAMLWPGLLGALTLMRRRRR